MRYVHAFRGRTSCSEVKVENSEDQLCEEEAEKDDGKAIGLLHGFNLVLLHWVHLLNPFGDLVRQFLVGCPHDGCGRYALVELMILVEIGNMSIRVVLERHGLGLMVELSAMIRGCHLHATIRSGLLALVGQQLEDVVIEDDFVHLDGLSAEGTDGSAVETGHALLADGVVHGADDDGPLVAAVVAEVADVAFVDVCEFLV